MFRNHLINAFRHLLKQKGFSLIHIGGLAIGLTAGIYVFHYARLEFRMDRFHERADQIYRVTTSRVKDGAEVTRFASTYAGAGPALKAEYPEIQNYTRLFHRHRGGIVSYETTHFREQGIFHADSGFFDVFSFPVLAGKLDDLHSPGVAFIEEATAKKYFGDTDPIGKRISFGSTNGLEEYEIRGVLRCPENSSIRFTFIFSYHDLGRLFGTDHWSNWTWLDFHTFIKLKDGTDAKIIEGRFPALLTKFRGDRASSSRLSLQNLPDIYLTSKTEFETGKTGNETLVRVLLALGIIIILIVWLNFVNLSTSRALTRAKEVGIRKTLGSSRQNLVLQFFIETALVNLMALVLSCLLLWLMIPYFNQLTGRFISFERFVATDLWKYMGLFFVTGTFVIGLYPALQLSAFKPTEVLKGFFIPKGKGAFLREMFVGLQALVSFSLVAAILIIMAQVKYVNSKSLGIDLQNTLAVLTPDIVSNTTDYLSSLESYKNEMMQQTGILSASTSVDSPGQPVEWIGGCRKLGDDPNESISVYRSIIDDDFLETLQLKLIAGQPFRNNQNNHDILINRTAVRNLGFSNLDNSIGQRIISGIDTCTIVGIIEDFHQTSPRHAISPTIYHYNLETPRLFLIKFNATDPQEVINTAQAAYNRLFPGVPFDYYFLEEFYGRQYSTERNLTAIISVFCFLAISVSSLGLLGLTWFRLSRQRKELAVRKIIGSTNGQLFYQACNRLIATTILGCLVGIPIVWFVMQQWLEGFAYHTRPTFIQFAVALLSSLFIALLTVSGYTWKVIRENPVNHLRQD